MLLLLIDKCYKTYFLSSTNCICLAIKIYRKYIILRVLYRDSVVLLLPMEEKKIHREENFKGDQNQYVLPLIMKLVW